MRRHKKGDQVLFENDANGWKWKVQETFEYVDRQVCVVTVEGTVHGPRVAWARDLVPVPDLTASRQDVVGDYYDRTVRYLGRSMPGRRMKRWEDLSKDERAFYELFLRVAFPPAPRFLIENVPVDHAARDMRGPDWHGNRVVTHEWKRPRGGPNGLGFTGTAPGTYEESPTPAADGHAPGCNVTARGCVPGCANYDPGFDVPPIPGNDAELEDAIRHAELGPTGPVIPGQGQVDLEARATRDTLRDGTLWINNDASGEGVLMCRGPIWSDDRGVPHLWAFETLRGGLVTYGDDGLAPLRQVRKDTDSYKKWEEVNAAGRA